MLSAFQLLLYTSWYRLASARDQCVSGGCTHTRPSLLQAVLHVCGDDPQYKATALAERKNPQQITPDRLEACYIPSYSGIILMHF